MAEEERSHAAHFAAAQAAEAPPPPATTTAAATDTPGGAAGGAARGAVNKSGADRQCCCHEEECSLPAKPSCCDCCPSAPLDPGAVANAKLHATAAYTALNRTDPKAIWYSTCSVQDWSPRFHHPAAWKNGATNPDLNPETLIH